MALDSTRLESIIYAELAVKMKEKLDEYMPLPEGELAEPAEEHRLNFVEAMTQAIAAVLSSEIVTEIVDNLEINGVVTEVMAGTIVTAGSPASQSGPPAPLLIFQKNDGKGLVA